MAPPSLRPRQPGAFLSVVRCFLELGASIRRGRLMARAGHSVVWASTLGVGLLITAPAHATKSADDAGGSTTRPTALTIRDDLGRDVVVPRRCERVAALVPFAADMLLDLGVRPVLVPALPGGSPERWAGLATVAVDHSAGPNLEQTLGARPDLIVLTSAYAQFVDVLAKTAGVPVIVLDVDRLDDVARHQRTLGRVTGRDSVAERLAVAVESAAAAAATAARDDTPTSVLAIFGTPHAFYGFLPESYMGDLVQRASGRLVTEGLSSHRIFKGLAPLSMEAIVAKDPEVVLLVFHGAPEIAEAMLAKDPAWRQLSAVRNGRVHVLGEDNYVMHPGRESVRALGMIAEAIRPRAE